MVMEETLKYYDLLRENKYFEYFEVKKSVEVYEGMSLEELMEYWKKERSDNESYMTPYENPYIHIRHFESKWFDNFVPGDRIVVQEKIDGSNAHICRLSDSFLAYGQNFVLNEVNHLQGFWYFAREHYENIPSKYEGYQIYGEWLVPHHVEYPAEKYGDFYVFDVMKDGKYLPQSKVKEIAEECGFTYVPVLYEGFFSTWKELSEFIGQTRLGGEKGEGIVVKNQSRLNTGNKHQYYVKLVSKEFQETTKHNGQPIVIQDLDEILGLENKRLAALSILTLARTRKHLLKAIDEGELLGLWFNMSRRTVLKVVKDRVYKDCISEEKETVDKAGDSFRIYCNNIVKEHLDMLEAESRSNLKARENNK